MKNQITRRAILRGTGCALALPWLESLAAKANETKFPQRFGVVFLGCGVNEHHWTAEGNGAEMKLGKSLAPLEPLKHKLNVIHGHQAGAVRRCRYAVGWVVTICCINGQCSQDAQRLSEFARKLRAHQISPRRISR
jgi:hypothetical protein